jgi:hypothetical protein
MKRSAALPLAALAVLAALATAGTSAAPVYRCSAGGRLAFQDHPCAAGEDQRIVTLRPAPAAGAPASPAAPAALQDATPAAVPSTAPVANAPPPPAPPPDFFLCTRYDGSRYASDTGIGSRVAVPYAMIGDAGLGLAQAYGGRNGIGVSAPGLRTPPRIPASRAPLAGAYVEVHDECHRAQPDEACAWLRAQLDDVERALPRAFSDTRPGLEQRRSALQARASGCP